MSFSSSEIILTPDFIKEEAQTVVENLLPTVSKERYMKSYSTLKQQQRGSQLKLLFSVVGKDNDCSNFISEPFDADDLAMVRFFLWNMNNKLNVNASVKKSEAASNSIIEININGDKIEACEQVCSKNWSDYKLLSGHIEADSVIDCEKCLSYIKQKMYLFTLEVTITVKDVTHSLTKYQGLYEDTQFTDFVLSTQEGSVALHKVVLVSHSELFQTYLKKGSVEATNQFFVQGTTVQTLQHLKDYMYLGTLPVAGLPQLLLFAIQSKMNKLKSDCIIKLATVVTAGDLNNLIDFAIHHKIPELVEAMLSVTSDSAIHGAHRIRKNKMQFCMLNLTQLALE